MDPQRFEDETRRHEVAPCACEKSPRRALCATVLSCALAFTPSLASADDEVHWLEGDRYLLSYRERNARNPDRALDNALERAAALCQLTDKGAYAVDLADLRHRIRTVADRLAVDVILLAAEPASPDANPPGRVVRSCSDVEIDRKVLNAVREAVEEADLQPDPQ